MLQALFWTIVISLSLAYASTMPAIKPIVVFISGLRYLGLVGLMLVFTLLAPDGSTLKVMVLTFGVIEVSWYFVYALGGRGLATWLRAPARRRLFNRVTAGIFVAFGVAIAGGRA
jgi:hypothetical protein